MYGNHAFPGLRRRQHWGASVCVCLCMCLCLCVCVRARVRACVRECKPSNTDMVNMCATDALANGDIDQDAMRYYLIQDHRFLDDFVILLASMVSMRLYVHIYVYAHEREVLDPAGRIFPCWNSADIKEEGTKLPMRLGCSGVPTITTNLICLRVCILLPQVAAAPTLEDRIPGLFSLLRRFYFDCPATTE